LLGHWTCNENIVRLCSTFGPKAGIQVLDCLRTSKPSQYTITTKVNSVFHPSGVGKSTTWLVGVKWGTFTCVQITLGLEQYQKSYPIPNTIGSCRYQYPIPIPIPVPCPLPSEALY